MSGSIAPLAKLPRRCTRTLLPALLCLAALLPAHASDTPSPATSFGPVLQPLILAEQQAVSSGNADAVIENSRSLAIASLRVLAAMDPADHAGRKALDALPSADTLVPDLPTQLLLLQSELKSDETAASTDLIQHILASNPDSAELHVALSRILQQAFDPEQAVREATRAVDLNPKSIRAQLALGMALWQLNNFQYNEQTLRAFTAAQALDPQGYAPNLSLGWIESQYHQFDQAAVHLRAASAADPSAPEPWFQLGLNAWDQDHPSDADAALHRYLSLVASGGSGKPVDIRRALLTLDQIAEEQGLPPDPAHLAKEAALKQQIVAQLDVAAFGPGGGASVNPAAIQDHSSVAPAIDPASGIHATPQQVRELVANSLNDLGTALARRHDYAAAVIPFRYAAQEDPTLDPVMRNLGFSAFLSGDYDESETALRQVAAATPEDATARAYLGMALFETGQYAEAATIFSSFGSGLSSQPLVEATAAAAFARSGQRDRAQSALADLRDAAADPQVQAREAVAWLDLGDMTQAAQLATAALAENAQTTDALLVMGQIDLEQGDDAGAARAFQDELKVNGLGTENLLETQALLAEALIESGRKTQGELISRQLEQTHPTLADNLRRQGESLLKNGDAQAAYVKLGAALLLQPGKQDLRAEFHAAERLIHPTPHPSHE